jgi:hypothetical protein
MKKTALLIAVLAISGIFAPVANAISLNIDIGDHDYYTHGGGYWRNGAYYVWVPGHWVYRHHEKFWVHGHYALR